MRTIGIIFMSDLFPKPWTDFNFFAKSYIINLSFPLKQDVYGEQR
jgi:hypothetical protein